jgi:Tol biopolymer transport system component
LPLDGDKRPFPVAQTGFVETDAQVSPDGKWVAYQSNESGRFEVYVQPFPGPGAKSQISAQGGVQVRWSADGKELFYLTPDNRLMSVPVQVDEKAARFDVGAPVSLFAARLSGSPQNGFTHQYVVSRDGRRFLIDALTEITSSITVVLNWKPQP